jgi:patatin-related protein
MVARRVPSTDQLGIGRRLSADDLPEPGCRAWCDERRRHDTGTRPGEAAVKYDATSEVRFAVVLYGGVSLAIYMNGIAQELLELVRATSPSISEPGTLAVADADLSASGRVYRELGRRLDQGTPVDTSDNDPVRTRFVVDIITGTSAGGINGVVLAKALANDQSISALSDLWVSEGDIDRLINDKQALKGLELTKSEQPPLSLLSGDRMLYLLLRAIDRVSESNQDPSERSPHADQIDLWITTTDLEGRPDKVDLSRGGAEAVTEPNHRVTFHFVYDHRPESPEPLNLLAAEYDPMLAFAARCTSSFPGAFKPVQLADLDPIMDAVRREVAGRGRTPTEWPGLDDDRIASFFTQYGRDHPEAWTTVSFADGGYLNNRPVDLVMETLPKRRASLPVARRVLIVEPDPGEPTAELVDEARSRIGLVPTLLKVISLPRKQTIGEVVDRILQLREPLRNRERIYEAVDAALDTDGDPSASPAAAGYRAYRLARTADDVGRGIARVGFPDRRYDDDTEQRRVASRLIETWLANPAAAGSAGDVGSRSDMLLTTLDLSYELRRINFLQGRAGRLMRTDPNRFGELRDARRKLDEIYTELAQAGRSLRFRREEAPELDALRTMMGDVSVTATDEELAVWLGTSGRDAVLSDALAHFASQLALPPVGPRIGKALEGLPDIQALASVFDRYDDATYALNAFIPGENDDIEVVRVSPRDTMNIRADSSSNPKLAGSAVHHFGAFFSADWRRNDIFWGRLDGAERVITSLYPATTEVESEDRRTLITEAQMAIIAETLQDDTYRQMLGRCFTGGEPPDKPEAGSPQAAAEAALVFEALRTAPPPPGPTPDTALATAARAARVTDRVGEGLGFAEGPGASASRWVSRVLRFGAGLAELALPHRVTSIVGRHLLDLAALAALTMILLGGIIGGPSVSGFGWTVLFITIALKIVLEVVRRWLQQPVSLGASLLAVALVVGFAVYAAAQTDGWRRVVVLLLSGFAVGLFLAIVVLRRRGTDESESRESGNDDGSAAGLGTTGLLLTALAILVVVVCAVLGVERFRTEVTESLCTDHPTAQITKFTTRVLVTSCEVVDV